MHPAGQPLEGGDCSKGTTMQRLWLVALLGSVVAVTRMVMFLAHLRFLRQVITCCKGRPGALDDIPEAVRAFPVLGRRAQRQPGKLGARISRRPRTCHRAMGRIPDDLGSNVCTIAVVSDHLPTIALPADITEWLISRAIKHHGRNYGAALEAVLRDAVAREQAATAGRVPEPVDLWAGVAAEARRRSR